MPSTKEAAPKSRAKAQPEPQAPQTPAEPVQPAAAEGEALFDPPAPPAPVEPAPSTESSEPESKEPVSPEPAAPEPAPEPQAPEPDDAEPAEPDQAEQEPSDFPIGVRLGQVEGLLHRVPIETVQRMFAGYGDRIEAGQSSPSIAKLQERMRASEGRCTPVVAAVHEDREVMEALAGVEAISAALSLGINHVFVITVASDDARVVQRHLAANAGGQPLSSETDCYQVVRPGE